MTQSYKGQRLVPATDRKFHPTDEHLIEENKEEVDQIVTWLTGYGQDDLQRQLAQKVDFETFFADAPGINPSRALIKGVVCGVRVEEIEDPLMREIRYLDKLIDELAKGKAMGKILRG